jgi:hypothetical protein
LFLGIDMEPIPIAETLFHGWGQDTVPNTRIKKRPFKLLDKCETEETTSNKGKRTEGIEQIYAYMTKRLHKF